MLWLRLTTVLMDFLGEMASVIWFCGDRSGNFLGLKNSLHYWILVLSPKQIVLLTLLSKLWEKIPWCKFGNRRFRKASLRKCRRFFVFVFVFFHVSVPKGSSASQAFLSKTVETGKKNRIMTTFIVCKWVLWWACSLFLTMTKMTHSVDHVLAVWQWCNFSPNWGPWFSCNYTCVLKSKYSGSCFVVHRYVSQNIDAITGTLRLNEFDIADSLSMVVCL